MGHRVLWQEGTLILPQHFQQQERFFSSEIAKLAQLCQPYYWGFRALEITESELLFGNITLSKCSGTFHDGTTFDAPQSNKLPPSLHLEDGIQDAIVYLVLPEVQLNVNQIATASDKTDVSRISPHTLPIRDNTTADPSSSDIVVGDVLLRLAVESAAMKIPDGLMKLPIAKIKEVSNGKIVLADDFIPCCVITSVSQQITRALLDLKGMLAARGDALANQTSAAGRTTGVAQYSDFLFLELINRTEPVLHQYISGRSLHPYDLYLFLISMAGELATFMKESRRPANFPVYIHDNQTECFNAVLYDINLSFSVVLDRLATQIELSKPKNNIRAARLSHKALLDSGVLILAVASNMSEEALRTEFPQQIKIGPGEVIFSLVQSAIPGIPIRLLTHVPYEIPYRAGHCYFELDKSSPYWTELQKSKGLAIHVNDNFPGLVMELWAVRQA